MTYFPQRARRRLDLASLFKVCPQCLGDLVFRSDFSGDYYCCLQCNVRTEPRNRIGRIAETLHPLSDSLVPSDAPASTAHRGAPLGSAP
jgi:acetyl-CoA carboxylase beta subunit